jgi:hypothetical protein
MSVLHGCDGPTAYARDVARDAFLELGVAVLEAYSPLVLCPTFPARFACASEAHWHLLPRSPELSKCGGESSLSTFPLL